MSEINEPLPLSERLVNLVAFVELIRIGEVVITPKGMSHIESELTICARTAIDVECRLDAHVERDRVTGAARRAQSITEHSQRQAKCNVIHAAFPRVPRERRDNVQRSLDAIRRMQEGAAAGEYGNFVKEFYDDNNGGAT